MRTKQLQRNADSDAVKVNSWTFHGGSSVEVLMPVSVLSLTCLRGVLISLER